MGRWAPFVWLVLIPVLTVPLTQALAGQILQSSQCSIAYVGSFEEAERWLCPDRPVLLSLLPGLLNLGPFVWLVLPGDDIMRRNAVVAGSLGAARLLVPVLGVLLTGPSPGRTILVSSLVFVYPNGDYLPVVGISVLLWIISVVTWIWRGIVESSRLPA